MESATNTGTWCGPGDRGRGHGGAAPALGHAALSSASRRNAGDVLRDYLALTKPRIISLLLVTTVGAMFVADPSGPALTTILWTAAAAFHRMVVRAGPEGSATNIAPTVVTRSSEMIRGLVSAR